MFGKSRSSYNALSNDVEDNKRITHERPLVSHDSPDVFFAKKSVSNTTKKRRWDHIENVDQFFTMIYEYHQGNGLVCIGLRQILSLCVFIYVVCFSTFLGQCIDYDVLFNNRNTTTAGELVTGKRQFKDAVVPHCVASFHPIVVLALFLATCFCLWQLICIGYHLLQLQEIKIFYTTELLIEDSQLSNTAWHTVVARLCDLQPKLHLIINQDKITPLDVYQRILRYKNYLVALIYNDIIPCKISLPFLGREIMFMSSGLRLNIEWLLFWGPWSPWKNAYALKNEYKNDINLETLAKQMRRNVMNMALANLLLFPFIFVYQIIFHFFSYADSVKREPGIFGARKYANYGRERLRHFNELDHELQARLNRSYSFAVRYMDQFFSPVSEIIATKVALVVGSIFAVFALLSAWDEDVLTLEHVITVMAVCGTVAMVCRSLIPNENLVYCQDFLMRQIVAHTHYAPKAWLEMAHSSEVCHEFSQLFQLRAQCLVEELISPIVTPFILFFSVREKAYDFVFFFHSHTKSVDGIGDVCSYSLMDISSDGDARLASLNESMTCSNSAEPISQKLVRHPAFCGKVEMSLLNFATMNPDWVPPPVYVDFINRVKECTSEMITQDSTTAVVPNSLQELDASIRGNADNSTFLAKNATTLTPLATVGTTPISLAGGRIGVSQQTVSADTPISMSNVQTSMVASLSNINSYIAQHINGHYHPRNVMECNYRALEMSCNALMLNRMMAVNRSNSAAPNGNNHWVANNSYGTLGVSQLGSASIYGASAIVPPMRGGAVSSLWGVPELSQPLLNEDNDDIPSQNANVSTIADSLYRA